MKYLTKIAYYCLTWLLLSCNLKPCENVTDEDIIGYYVSANPANKNRQYIEISTNHTFIMFYCNGDSIVDESGVWNRYDGCRVMLNGIRWFNTSNMKDTVRYTGYFDWVRGKLAMGEDYWSFDKVWKKPKLICKLR